ncbi:restriction endonuclease subunit S [Mycoplasma sp. 005V]|uniref:restriction endonuclease subunit S n=1 Tax=Mycoplasma sp. 005V TaxID=3398776 RepID=UPI003A87C8D7
MMTNKKAPEIRFKNHEDNWKKTKFKELYKPNNEKNFDIKYNEEYIISVANMYFKEDQKITNLDYLKSYNIFKIGDIAFEGNKSQNYKYGRFVENTIGAGIVSHVFEVFTPITEQYDLQFWKYYINNERVMQNVLRNSTKLTTMMSSLVKNDLLNQYLNVPNLIEQQKIGSLLSNIDTLITSQELKLKKLQTIKQSLLDKMFASNNERVPKIRFKGFEDSWKVHKILELAKFRRGSFPQPYGEEKWYSGPNAMPFVQVADVNEYLSLKKETKQKISQIAIPFSVFVPDKSIIVTLQGTIGRVALTKYDCYIDRTILYFSDYKKAIDKDMFARLIKIKFQQEALLAPGAVIKTITKQELNNFKLYLPNYDEQQKIGLLLSNLDTLITNQETKLEKLNNIKKSLLDKMFC